MTRKEFEEEYHAGLDSLLGDLADHPDVDVGRFYKLTYLFENLAFFSPILWGLIEQTKNKKST